MARKTSRATKKPAPDAIAKLGKAAQRHYYEGVNVHLTVADRDAIDNAKARLRGYVIILRLITVNDCADDTDIDEALSLVVEEMGDAIAEMDATFERADVKEEARSGSLA